MGTKALEAVQGIAHALDGWSQSGPTGQLRKRRRSPEKDPSLATGRAGLAVFFGYLAQRWPEEGYAQTAVRLLEDAVDLVAETNMDSSLYGGFTGVAWVASHLQGHLLDADGNDPNEDVDALLLSCLHERPWTREYELVSGVVGYGVYALERLPRPAAARCLAAVIDCLEMSAERSRPGLTWFSPAERLPDHQRAECPLGHYNLGLAHGVPGVIAILGAACAAGVACEKARRLLDGAVRWLLAQDASDRASAAFPYWVGPDITPQAARSAWCYGDPGIAVALLVAADCVGDRAWGRRALAIARRAAARPPHETGVCDAGLCHGAAGLGHLFNRMFQITGDVHLKAAARFWFERTLEFARPGKGIAGFSSFEARKDGKGRWVDDPGIPTGAAGIALALLSAATPIEPAWDRLLLASIRTPPFSDVEMAHL